MGTIATISIDLTKLDKSKIVSGKKGQKYYNLNISINEMSDNYGNNIRVTEPQTKEEREKKVPLIYYGNGKVFWTDGKIEVAKKNETINAPQTTNSNMNSDDLPF